MALMIGLTATVVNANKTDLAGAEVLPSDLSSALIWLGILIAAAILLHLVVGALLSRASKMTTGRMKWGGIVAGALQLPVGLAIWLLAATWIIEHGAGVWVQLAGKDDAVALDAAHLVNIILPQLRIIIVVFCGTLFVVRAVRRTQQLIEHQAAVSGSEMDLTALQALFGIGVVVVWVVGGIVGMQALGMNMSAILTIGGIGSAAFAFASKDVIANFFGGIMVLFNRPFRVGDWVLVKGVEGGVERIGLYATHIRTGDKRLVYIPNSTFVSSVIENFSERANRRLSETIGVRYDDFEVVNVIIDDIHKALQSHEAIDDDQAIRVSFGGYGDSSIDITILAYSKTSALDDFLDMRRQLMLEVGRIVHGHGADFAFPTMTLDMPPKQEVSAAH